MKSFFALHRRRVQLEVVEFVVSDASGEFGGPIAFRVVLVEHSINHLRPLAASSTSEEKMKLILSVNCRAYCVKGGYKFG